MVTLAEFVQRSFGQKPVNLVKDLFFFILHINPATRIQNPDGLLNFVGIALSNDPFNECMDNVAVLFIVLLSSVYSQDCHQICLKDNVAYFNSIMVSSNICLPHTTSPNLSLQLLLFHVPSYPLHHDSSTTETINIQLFLVWTKLHSSLQLSLSELNSTSHFTHSSSFASTKSYFTTHLPIHSPPHLNFHHLPNPHHSTAVTILSRFIISPPHITHLATFNIFSQT
jgi:hypothetical protein